MTDKTIRYTIDDKGVSQANSKIRQSYEDLNKDLTHMSASQRKLGKDEIKDIQDKIKLLKQKNDLEEAALRKRIQDKQLEIQLAEKDLALWKARRIDDASKLPSTSRGKFVAETTREENRRRSAITEERVSVLDDRAQYADIRDKNKKQISELQNISHTLNRNTDKTIRSTENVFSNVFRGITSGSVGGAASMLGMMGAAGGVASLVVGTMTANYKKLEDEVTASAVKLQIPVLLAKALAIQSRDKTLGMSGAEILNKVSTFSGPAGRYMTVDETRPIIGSQVARGFTDQQINQLISINRYTGRSVLGTTSDLERYAMSRDKSLAKLPELLDFYLKISSEILNRTGRVDAIGVQQSMTSVGKSYGVSGLQLERTMTGLTQLSTLSDNPVLLSIQQQAFRKLYPGKSPIEMLKALQNPAEDPKLMEEIRGRLSRFGGGGVYGTLGMTSLLGGDVYTAERLMKGGIGVEPRVKEPASSTQKDIENKIYTEAGDYVGSMQSLANKLGSILDFLNKGPLVLESILNPDFHRSLERTMENATYKGSSRANKEIQR